MLERAYHDERRPTLAATRVARMSGHVLESIGRYRHAGPRRDDAARLLVRGEGLQRLAEDVCRLHGFERRVEGVLPNRPAILIANHVSYADAPVLASLTPSTVVAKAEVERWPLLGASARAMGVLFVRRGDAWSGARALRRGLRALEAGVSIIGFPEGTTSSGNDVLPFRRGLFGLARLAGVPVVPVAIHCLSRELRWFGDDWFLPHYLRTAMRPRSLVHVRLGRAIAPDVVGSPEDLAHRTRSAIRTMLLRVRA